MFICNGTGDETLNPEQHCYKKAKLASRIVQDTTSAVA